MNLPIPLDEATIILLDVDGTLVRLPYDLASRPDLWASSNAAVSDEALWASAPFHTGINVRIRHEVIEALRRWHAAGAQLMWLTSWFGAANEYLAETLGIPQLPVLHDRGGDMWKLNQAKDVGAANPGRAVVWAEDEELSSDEVKAWKAGREEATLLLECDSSWGMSDEHIAQVDTLLGLDGRAAA